MERVPPTITNNREVRAIHDETSKYARELHELKKELNLLKESIRTLPAPVSLNVLESLSVGNEEVLTESKLLTNKEFIQEYCENCMGLKGDRGLVLS